MRPGGKETAGFLVTALVAASGVSCRWTADPEAAGGWACPMHPEVVAATLEACRVCGMKLEPRHASGAYVCLEDAGIGSPGTVETGPGPCGKCGRERAGVPAVLVHECPAHEGISLREPGSCPLCGRALLPRTVAILWSCPEHPRPLQLAPGACARCAAALAELLVDLPHGDHSPKHGGIFFMAEDRWHHIEGTLPAPDLFRLHVYDDFTRPLRPDGIEARIVRLRTPKDGDGERETPPIQLAPSAAGDALEARIDVFELPVELTLEARFPHRGGEQPLERPQRFDFAFAKLSSDEEVPSGPEARLPPLEVPSDPRHIAEELGARAREVKEIVGRRGLAEVYAPALRAKDLALALRDRAARPEDGGALERAARKIVRGAWLLDLHGDQGNREGVERANALLQEGVTDLVEAARRAWK